MQYRDYPYGSAMKGLMGMIMIMIIGLLMTCHAYSQVTAPPITYKYTIAWMANTEADLAGYILESSDNGSDPWTVEKNDIASNVTTYTVGSTKQKKCFRLSAYDRSQNVSTASQAKCAQFAADGIAPLAPGNINVSVAQIIGPVSVPDMSNVKYTYTGRTVTFTWDAKDFETEITVVGAQNTTETVLATVTRNQGTYTYTATAGDWRCHKLRHKSGTTYGNFASADPNNPADVNFCMTLQ